MQPIRTSSALLVLLAATGLIACGAGAQAGPAPRRCALRRCG